MADIFDAYRLAEAWDEMFSRPGEPRGPYDGLLAALQPLDTGELRFRSDQLARMFTDRGVTFDYAGEERPFPLDLIPRIIDAVEWDLVARGVRQRVLALEAFLADVYEPRQAFGEGCCRGGSSPPRSIPPRGGRAGAAERGPRPRGRDRPGPGRGRPGARAGGQRPDPVRGQLRHREPARHDADLPALFAEQHVHPVYSYPAELLAALRAAAPAGTPDPVVVVLTPGTANAAYFEHALLARLMGVELVEGGDLTCAGNRVYVHTTQGLRPVDVIYRRVDDDFLDPLQFRPDSVIGCPGMVNAARAGHVTIANAVGNGVADDKLLYTWVPT